MLKGLTWFALCSVTTAGLVGCSQERHGNTYDLVPRLEAARDIKEPRTHDESVRAVALDAIYNGNAPLAVDAVRDINDPETRGQVAAQCARWLNAKDRKADARMLAVRIPDTQERDQVLREIAMVGR